MRKHPGRCNCPGGKCMFRSIVDPWLAIEAHNGRLQHRVVDLMVPAGQAELSVRIKQSLIALPTAAKSVELEAFILMVQGLQQTSSSPSKSLTSWKEPPTCQKWLKILRQQGAISIFKKSMSHCLPNCS